MEKEARELHRYLDTLPIDVKRDLADALEGETTCRWYTAACRLLSSTSGAGIGVVGCALRSWRPYKQYRVHFSKREDIRGLVTVRALSDDEAWDMARDVAVDEPDEIDWDVNGDGCIDYTYEEIEEV